MRVPGGQKRISEMTRMDVAGRQGHIVLCLVSSINMCNSVTCVDTLSPIIMVQWKMTLNERKRSYWRDPFSTSMMMAGRVNIIACLERLEKDIMTIDLLQLQAVVTHKSGHLLLL